MPTGGGSIVTVPNHWSSPIYMSAILGGGSGATISIRTSSDVQPGFSGPHRGVLSYVNESGYWVDKEFMSSGDSASISVHTGGDSAFEPHFKLGSPSPLPLTIFYDWNVRGSTNGNEANSVNEKAKDTKQKSNSASEEVIQQTSDTADDLFLKQPGDLTGEELRELMKKRSQSNNEKTLFNELVEKEREWFSTRYGNKSVKFDETGKMIQPVPVNPAPKDPKPVVVPGGIQLADAIQKVAEQLNNTPGEKTDVIRGLQIGINRTKEKTATPLKTDGQFGPKSSQALKKAIAVLGSNRVKEANALGQFQNKVLTAKKSRDVKNALADISNTFDPLLLNKKNEDKDKSVMVALQSAINETTKDDDTIPTLKEDGIFGPKTEDAFGMVAKKKDPEELTNNFGYFLGFA